MNKKGFTLIEFSIYITVTTMALVILGSTVASVFWGKTALMTSEEVGQNARFALAQIASSIRNAESINTPLIGENGQTLSLAFTDSNKNPTIFSLSDGYLMVQEGSDDPVALNSEHVRFTNLLFTNISYDDTPGTICISATIDFFNPGERKVYDFQQTFYLTTSLRGIIHEE